MEKINKDYNYDLQLSDEIKLKWVKDNLNKLDENIFKDNKISLNETQILLEKTKNINWEKNGETGYVAALQASLKFINDNTDASCSPGILDSMLKRGGGGTTREGLRSFQKWYNKKYEKNITVDGKPGPESINAILETIKKISSSVVETPAVETPAVENHVVNLDKIDDLKDLIPYMENYKQGKNQKLDSFIKKKVLNAIVGNNKGVKITKLDIKYNKEKKEITCSNIDYSIIKSEGYPKILEGENAKNFEVKFNLNENTIKLYIDGKEFDFNEIDKPSEKWTYKDILKNKEYLNEHYMGNFVTDKEVKQIKESIKKECEKYLIKFKEGKELKFSSGELLISQEYFHIIKKDGGYLFLKNGINSFDIKGSLEKGIILKPGDKITYKHGELNLISEWISIIKSINGKTGKVTIEKKDSSGNSYGEEEIDFYKIINVSKNTVESNEKITLDEIKILLDKGVENLSFDEMTKINKYLVKNKGLVDTSDFVSDGMKKYFNYLKSNNILTQKDNKFYYKNWQLSEMPWYKDQYPNGQDIDYISFILKNGDKQVVFDYKDLSSSSDKIKFLDKKIKIAEQDYQSEIKDEANIKNFDLPKNEKILYISLTDSSDDVVTSGIRKDGEYLGEIIKNRNSNTETVNIKIDNNKPIDILKQKFEYAKNNNIKNIFLNLIAHGSENGVAFSVNGKRIDLKSKDVEQLLEKYPNINVTLSTVACHGGGVENFSLSKDLNRNGKLTTFLQVQSHVSNQEGRINGIEGKNKSPKVYSTYYNVYLNYYLTENPDKTFGKAHLYADKMTKKIVGNNAQAIVNDGTGGIFVTKGLQ